MLPADEVERLARYLDGDLSPEEAEAVRLALAQRPELREVLQQLQGLAEVSAELAQQPHGLDVEGAIRRAVAPARASRRRWPLLVAVAALLALLAGRLWSASPGPQPAPPEVAHASEQIAGIEVLSGTEHQETGVHVSRLDHGTALYRGDWLVVTAERTLEVHGAALISTNPSDAVSHVTSFATPTIEESDMIRMAIKQWSVGGTLAVLTLSGVVQADAPVKAGQAWVAPKVASTPKVAEKKVAPAPEPKCEKCSGDAEPEEPGPKQDVSIGNSPTLGPADAKVTVVLFSEAECSYCVKAHAVMKQLHKELPDKVRFVFKQFPLKHHEAGRQAAIALQGASGSRPRAGCMTRRRVRLAWTCRPTDVRWRTPRLRR
jgi:Thioredoxin